MKKPLVLFLSSFLSVASVSAAETYRCTGENEDGKADEMVLVFENLEKVKVEALDGDFDLDAPNEKRKYKYYGNYDYDGYGGSVELRVPAKLEISGPRAMEEFKAFFKLETYSEIGHVGTNTIDADCTRSDD